MDQRNYPEDQLPDGSGLYNNICVTCEQPFTGYKSRLSCKVCLTDLEERLAAMTPEERETYDIEWAKNFRRAAVELGLIPDTRATDDE